MDDHLHGTHVVYEEIIRLIGGTLQRMGGHDTVSALEAEFGVPINSPTYESLRILILNGSWEECLNVLEDIEMTPTERKNVLSAVTLQRYLEIVKGEVVSGEQIAAVASAFQKYEEIVVGDTLNLSTEFKNRMRNLSMLLVVPDHNVPPRYDLLVEIEKALKPGAFVVNHLIELLEETLSNQNKACRYHNSIQQKISLFGHTCNMDENLSCTLQQTPQAHNDDILYVRFSNSGGYLASFGIDATIIWQVNENNLIMKHRLNFVHDEDADPNMGFMCWSPDDSEILISRNGILSRWNIGSGQFLDRFQESGLISCSWSLDDLGNSIIFTVNHDNSISLWKGFMHYKVWLYMTAVIPHLSIKDKRQLVFCSQEDVISLFDWENEEEVQLYEDCSICSFSLSRDGKSLVVSMSDRTVTLWKLDGRPKKMKVFYDSEVSNFSTDVCFGGVEEGFVATSCNLLVHIWNKYSCELVCTLEGHRDIVRSICWNPSNPTMLVSCGHDLRVWGRAQAQAQAQEF